MDWLSLCNFCFFLNLVNLDSLVDEATLDEQFFARYEFDVEELTLVLGFNYNIRILHGFSEVVKLVNSITIFGVNI